MSIKIMTAVWELCLPDSEKLALLALADCANDEGLCWPSMATLARKCSKSDRTLQKAVVSLSDKGHLSRDERPGKGVLYRIHPRSDCTPEVSDQHPRSGFGQSQKKHKFPPTPSGETSEATGVDPGDQFWRVPAGRSWKETTGMLRELNRKPKRKPRRNSGATRDTRIPANPSYKTNVLARQSEDEQSHELRSSLKQALGNQVFNQWFETAALLFNNSEVTVVTASQFQSEWIEQNFRAYIFSAAQHFLKDGTGKINFQTETFDKTFPPKSLSHPVTNCSPEIDAELPI